MKRIGLLGGTFDPPHIGHLIIATEVLEQMELDEIWFIPTNKPPHKQEARSSTNDRVHMLQVATKDNPVFHVSTIEVDKPQVSYTIWTVKELQGKYPSYHFSFIIGADMVEYLPHWYQVDELMQLIEFVGVKRPGYRMETSYPIKEVTVPLIDISSSMIRHRIQAGKSYRYLVVDQVAAYIKESHIYGNK